MTTWLSILVSAQDYPLKVSPNQCSMYFSATQFPNLKLYDSTFTLA